jgi:hypothetical protein
VLVTVVFVGVAMQQKGPTVGMLRPADERLAATVGVGENGVCVGAALGILGTFAGGTERVEVTFGRAATGVGVEVDGESVVAGTWNLVSDAACAFPGCANARDIANAAPSTTRPSEAATTPIQSGVRDCHDASE